MKYIAAAFLFLLPWQTRLIISSGSLNGEYWEYGTISLYAIDILLIVLIAFCLFGAKPLSNKKILLPVLLIGLALANIFSSFNPALSAFHWLWMLLALALYFALKHHGFDYKKLALAFVAGAAVAGIFGVWQFSSQSAPASKWFGLAEHQPAELGVSVIEAVAPDGVIERWLRAYGPFDHPNILGGYLALALIIAMLLALKINPKENKPEHIILTASIIGLSAGLVASFSRGAWLAALIAIIVILIQYKNQFKKLLPFLLISIIVIGLFVTPYYYLFAPRLNNDYQLEQISSSERLGGWKDSLGVVKKNLLIGSGLGTYGLALEQTRPNELVWFYQPVHNTFLLILAELGLIGLLLAGFLFKKLPLSILGALVVIALFDHWLLSLHIGPLVLATVAALTAGLRRDTLIS